MLAQEIVRFLRRTDDYQLDPDVEAFLLRGVKAYYIHSAFLYFTLVMGGTGLDGVRDGACWRFAWLCFAFRVMCLTQPALPESLFFGSCL